MAEMNYFPLDFGIIMTLIKSISFYRNKLLSVESNFPRRDIMHYETSDFLETADSDTLKQIARARELTREYYFSDYEDTGKRTAILRKLLGGMGENVAIDTPFHCDYGKNIFLGNDVIINMNCTFVDNQLIRIGNRVLIASNVQIYTSSHPILPKERLVPDWKESRTTFFRTYARPIEIKDNVWIGGGCILCYFDVGSLTPPAPPAV